MKQFETMVKADIQSISNSFLSSLIVSSHDWLNGFNVVICKLLKPEVIKTLDHVSVIVIVKSLVCESDQFAQFSEDPFVIH
jgi:hypothetical protein